MPWKVLWVGMPVIFTITWLMMRYGEGTDKPIAELSNFWWYFIVTAATVGYGDLYPASPIGRVAGLLIIIFGITLFGITIAKVTEIIITNRERRIKGKMNFTKETNHTLIVGYTAGEVELLVKELMSDTTERQEKIILVSGTLTANPMPDRIEFVSGDPLEDETLIRAGIAGADRIIIFGDTEYKVVSYAIAIMALASETARVVAVCHGESCATQLKRVNKRISPVVPQTVRIAAQELQDSGAAKMIEDLLSTDSGSQTIFTHHFQDGHPHCWEELATIYRNNYGAMLLAIKVADTEIPTLNPAGNTQIKPGTTVFYLAIKPIEIV